jgi:hypothetical protein
MIHIALQLKSRDTDISFISGGVELRHRFPWVRVVLVRIFKSAFMQGRAGSIENVKTQAPTGVVNEMTLRLNETDHDRFHFLNAGIICHREGGGVLRAPGSVGWFILVQWGINEGNQESPGISGVHPDIGFVKLFDQLLLQQSKIAQRLQPSTASGSQQTGNERQDGGRAS